MRGLFIAFEGPDGCGKSSLLHHLKEFLVAKGVPVRVTKEPTDDTSIGSLIHQTQRGESDVYPSPRTMLYLYAADREQHLLDIGRSLGEGYYVLCDRYKYSSLSYQGGEWESESMNTVASIQADFPDADYVVYVDTPVDVCIDRIHSRGEKEEIFEKKEFLEGVVQRYRECLAALGDRVLYINGNRPEEEVFKELLDKLTERGVV